MAVNQLQVARLKELATDIRRRDLKMVHRARLGHIGGDLSATDILTTLYFSVLKVESADPGWAERDRFILSKGHCAGALYATLAEAGFIGLDELDTYMQPKSRLGGHPDRTKMPGVETNTGPLGHGLPVAVGCALGAKMDGAAWRTFVLTGDGELQEGSNWEAAMTASPSLRVRRIVSGLSFSDTGIAPTVAPQHDATTLHVRPMARSFSDDARRGPTL